MSYKPGLPSNWSYLIQQTSTGCRAINGATGAVEQNLASLTDHSTVFQYCINKLAVQNGGTGGSIALQGQLVLNNPITLYPGVGLVGQGPLGNKGVQPTGAIIQSNYSGSTIVITGTGASNAYFPYIANLTIYGHSNLTGQNLVEINASGGTTVNDVILSQVTFFDAGQHGVFLNSATKLWMDLCYLEGCAGDGLNIANAGTFSIINSYIFGQTGTGINVVNGGTGAITNNRIWNNGSGSTTQYAINIQGCTVTSVVGNSLVDNGGTNSYAMRVGANTSTAVEIVGNSFLDDRSASAVNRFISLGDAHATSGCVSSNRFSGHKAANAINVISYSTNTVRIDANQGYNDTVGTLATPFDSTANRIGAEGSSATVVASKAYKSCTPLFINSTGGTGTSITISSPSGAVVSGLATYSGILPVGYTINFGAFTVAPTVAVAIA